jgi:hypothetical protein
LCDRAFPQIDAAFATISFNLPHLKLHSTHSPSSWHPFFKHIPP